MPIRDSIANAFAAVDDVALQRSEQLRARIFELMFAPDQRDEVIFFQALDAVRVDPEMWLNVTPSDLNEVDPNDRDIDWIGVQAALSAAAVKQAQLELVYRPLLKTAHSGAQAIVLANSRLTNEQRKIAATEGTGKARFSAAAESIANGRHSQDNGTN